MSAPLAISTMIISYPVNFDFVNCFINSFNEWMLQFTSYFLKSNVIHSRMTLLSSRQIPLNLTILGWINLLRKLASLFTSSWSISSNALNTTSYHWYSHLYILPQAPCPVNCFSNAWWYWKLGRKMFSSIINCSKNVSAGETWI